MDKALLDKLGPLAPLAGIWRGQPGSDVAPDDDRGVENNTYREELSLVPFGPVDNHEQHLWGLQYTTKAWRVDANSSFHDEVGYWLWDPEARQVMRCFLVPRGIAVIAGATVDPGARRFTLEATLGSPTYGICSNPFLDREFQTVKYEVKITIFDDNRWRYEEDTVLRMKGRAELFHHTDQNTLVRAG